MKEKMIQGGILILAAVGMLAALVLVGRWGLYILDSSQRTAEATQPVTQPTQAVAPETQPATQAPTAPEMEPATVPTTEAAEPEPTAEPSEVAPTEETLPPQTEPPRVTIDTVPQYFQTDYPDVRYGTGTIADSGCNMTSLAMVASYLTDHEYYPDEIADYMADFIGNNIERLDYGSDLLQLSWRRAGNFYDALNALKEGKVVIAVMNSKSLFTTGQHFIVWTGITEDGKVLVHDPNEKNYTAWNLKDGFADGFREGLVLAGYAGGWIYDKAEMPEEPFIYEPVPYAEECRYGNLELTDAEWDMIAKLIWAEGESEPFEGQQAIAEVILNRLVAGNFPSTVENIIKAPGQFEGASKLYKAEPTYTQYKAIERALYGPYVVPEDVVFFARFAVNDKVWGKIGAHTFCYSYSS